jgi:hypothetical protein
VGIEAVMPRPTLQTLDQVEKPLTAHCRHLDRGVDDRDLGPESADTLRGQFPPSVATR